MNLLSVFRRRSVAPEPARVEAAAGPGPARETIPFPLLLGLGSGQGKRPAVRPTPRNLKAFARTVYARRAICAIKDPIAGYKWEVAPKEGIRVTAEIKRQCAVATACLANPNEDDSFRTLIEAVIEDWAAGAGAIEVQVAADPKRPLWLFPVDASTVLIYPAWNGDPEEARYVQVPGLGTRFGGGGDAVPLRNDELVYIRPNPRSDTPYGLGPLEVAFTSIARQLGVAEFAGNVSSNSRPSVALDLGAVSAEYASTFRNYWEKEIEGQGKMPVIASGGDTESKRSPQAIKLYPEGDKALFLQYQDFLKREIAIAFNLSPMNLGSEHDVNRASAEVAEDRDRDQAIKPVANSIAAYLTREVLNGRLGWHGIEFRFVGMDPDDEEALSKTFERAYRNNALTSNEWRARMGFPPLKSKWGDMVYADVEIAKQAARAGEVIDPDLDQFPTRPQPQREDQ